MGRHRKIDGAAAAGPGRQSLTEVPTAHPTLVIATTNAGKVREFVDLLADLPLNLRSLAEFPDAPQVAEGGATYEENAVGKASAVARWSRCVCLADDSGLEVDALGGAPSVYSARYAGVEQ